MRARRGGKTTFHERNPNQVLGQPFLLEDFLGPNGIRSSTIQTALEALSFILGIAPHPVVNGRLIGNGQLPLGRFGNRGVSM
jgi:hypothetical protein